MLAKDKLFHHLHQPYNPLILYNIWDVGSAKAVSEAGAKAIATGSWSVAQAQGFSDGEALPFENLLSLATRLTLQIDRPVSIDFETGYATSPQSLHDNTLTLLRANVVGVNFEDQIIGENRLVDLDTQCVRLKLMRQAAQNHGTNLFINARTDIFLQQPDQASHQIHLEAALIRAKAYADAGANGIFIPGLTDANLIARFCAASPLPVNVMMIPDMVNGHDLAQTGVARISHGPFPYRDVLRSLTQAAQEAFKI